eukprot:g1084.t1
MDSDDEEESSDSDLDDTEEHTENSDSKAHLYVFTANKAGTENTAAEKARQQRIIHEMSKNSSFYKTTLKKDQKLDLKIEKLREKLCLYRKKRAIGQSSQPRRQMRLGDFNAIQKANADTLPSDWDFSKTFVVCDMDQFFAAVAIRDNPSLKGKPVAVGGMGMISTASYEARKFGVRSAMPGFIAVKLCPQLIFVKSDFPAYKAASNIMKAVCKSYDPQAKMMSLDEAYLDITDYLTALKNDSGKLASLLSRYPDLSRSRENDLSELVVQEMRDTICLQTNGLTASAGIACNLVQAKMASNKNKPNGQYFVGRSINQIQSFLHPHEIRALPGVGKVNEKILRQVLGVQTVGDLLKKRNELSVVFSEDYAQHLIDVGTGYCRCRTLDGDNTNDGEKDTTRRTHKDTTRTEKDLVKNHNVLGKDDVMRGQYESISSNAVSPMHDKMGENNFRRDRKGISAERTFHATSSSSFILNKLHELALRLSKSLHEERLQARTISLKWKMANFEIFIKSQSSKKEFFFSADSIFNAVHALFRTNIERTSMLKDRIRLVGIRLSNLLSRGDQRDQTLTGFLRKKEKKKDKEINELIDHRDTTLVTNQDEDTRKRGNDTKKWDNNTKKGDNNTKKGDNDTKKQHDLEMISNVLERGNRTHNNDNYVCTVCGAIFEIDQSTLYKEHLSLHSLVAKETRIVANVKSSLSFHYPPRNRKKKRKKKDGPLITGYCISDRTSKKTKP